MGSVLALIGNIVAATAQSIPALIGATTMIGLAASTQLSFSFVSNDLVPMKYRFVTQRMAIYLVPSNQRPRTCCIKGFRAIYLSRMEMVLLPDDYNQRLERDPLLFLLPSTDFQHEVQEEKQIATV